MHKYLLLIDPLLIFAGAFNVGNGNSGSSNSGDGNTGNNNVGSGNSGDDNMGLVQCFLDIINLAIINTPVKNDKKYY